MNNPNSKVLMENEAITRIIDKLNLKENNKLKLLRIYNLVKCNIPEEIRFLCDFNYSSTTYNNHVRINIQNYNISLFPYSKDEVRLLYPKDDIHNLLYIMEGKRVKELCEYYKFQLLQCYAMNFKIDEILLFKEEQWESFNKACLMAAYREKVRYENSNMIVNWNKDSFMTSHEGKVIKIY